MKRRLIPLLTALWLCLCAPALAAPQLSDVLANDAALISGQDGWQFAFSTTEGGTLALQLLSGQTGEIVCDVGSVAVEAGHGNIAWNGLLPDGSPVPPGDYMLAVQLCNFWGEQSAQSLLSLHILGDAAQMADMPTAETLDLGATDAPATETLDLNAADAQDAQTWAQQTPDALGLAQPSDAVPVANSFWDMNPDLYDLTNPAHQQAIWDLMMQPITVLDVGQTEHVYPTNQPGVKRTPYEQNCAGELHGQSQGVLVLEDDTDGDGYVRIRAYSNDGTKTNNSYMESIDAQMIEGYVKKSLLFQVTPSNRYALLVDKLRQKLYVFEAGAIIGTLDISTGLNNDKQPYNETPAGEFITVSRVGDFHSGSAVGRFAIRINGGTLLHEVLCEYGADGKTRFYDKYEPQLGMKASHGCVRIQRRENAQGQNMLWLWNNLENRTKVFIWDDKGRQMYAPELPDPALTLYRNPNGGSNYHLDAYCSGVREKFLPLTGDFTYGDLQDAAYAKLTPCPVCAAPPSLETLYKRYATAASHIGYTIPDEVRAQFGVQ